MKLTSFDKLIERACSSIKNVRLCCEFDLKATGNTGNSGMAPDAAKYEESTPALKVAVSENAKGGHQDELCVVGYSGLNWLSFAEDVCEEDIVQRYVSMISADGESNWYGGTLIYDQDKNSEVYKHYAELCQGPMMDTFASDPEKEKHYADALLTGLDSTDDTLIEGEMEAALREYDQIGAELGIASSCRALAEDPSRLARWIIGEEKVQGLKK